MSVTSFSFTIILLSSGTIVISFTIIDLFPSKFLLLINALILEFNSAKSSGLYKYIVEYWVDVTLKDGTKRILRVNSSNIKEDNDYCFDLGDTNYLKILSLHFLTHPVNKK